MKKRERRRLLTQRYQRRQKRFAETFSGRKKYDSERHFLRASSKISRFRDIMKGNLVVHRDVWNRENKIRLILGWQQDLDGLSQKELGRYRRHSFCDCGRAHCPSCSNPRRVGWSKKERLTLAELRAEDNFKDDINLRKEEIDGRQVPKSR